MSAGGNDYLVQWKAEWLERPARVWSYRVKAKTPASAIRRSMEKIRPELVGNHPDKLSVLCVREELSPLKDWVVLP